MVVFNAGLPELLWGIPPHAFSMRMATPRVLFLLRKGLTRLFVTSALSRLLSCIRLSSGSAQEPSMPRRPAKYDTVEELDDPADGADGYDVRQHPTSKYVKNLRQEQPVQRDVPLPQRQHAMLIGKGGATRRELEASFRCTLDFPPREVACHVIHVEGLPADIDACVKRIHEIVAAADVPSPAPGRRGGASSGGSSSGIATGANVAAFPALPGDDIVCVNVDVEKFAHGKVIGTHGIRLEDLRRRLRSKGPGTPVINQHAGIDVKMPDREDTSSIITIHCPERLSTHVIATVQEFIDYYELRPHFRGISVSGVAMAGGIAGALLTSSSDKGTKAPLAGSTTAAASTAEAAAAPSRQPPAARRGGGGGRPSRQVASLSNDGAPTQSQVGGTPSDAAPISNAGPFQGFARPPRRPFVDLAMGPEGYRHPVLPQRLLFVDAAGRS